MKIKTIFLFTTLFASISIAQNPCGFDIAPKPDSLTGIRLGGSGCRFVAPGIDTAIAVFQDPARLIEWIHQDGYTDCATGTYKDGVYIEESTWKCQMSSTWKVIAWQDSTRSHGMIDINGQRFYQYLPDGIYPDKNGTYNAGYGDAAPAYCGCLRRVMITSETLYAGSGKITPVKLRPDYEVDPLHGFSPQIQGAHISTVSPEALHPIAKISDPGFSQGITSQPIDPGFLEPPNRPHRIVFDGIGSVIITYHADGSVTLESNLKPKRKTFLQKIKRSF